MSRSATPGQSKRFRFVNTSPIPALTQMESLERRQMLSVVRPDHIVIVIEQDRACEALGDTTYMPYFNQLINTGLFYSNSHGVMHPSQPNFHALYAGTTQGITTNDQGYSFPTEANLAKSLFDAGFSFAGYSENLPFDGSQAYWAGDSTYPDLYARYLNPMAQYLNAGIDPLTNQPRPNSAVNKTFAAFSSIPIGDYSSLPTVSLIVPNNLNSTHGSNEAYPWAGSPDVENNNLLRSWADAWLRNHLDNYLTWAKANNSLLIVTGDEERWVGGTAASVTTIVNGDPDLFVPGVNGTYVNHYNLLRTIEDMYGLSPLGQSAAVPAFDTNAQGQLTGATVAQTATTTTVASSSPSSVAGQSVTFTATVTPASGSVAPTGSVSFMDGLTTIGTGVLNSSGQATLTTSSLTVGSHSIIASYQGTTGFTASTSPPLAQTVTAVPAPANDNFVSRTTIDGTAAILSGTNAGATKEAGEPSHAGNAGGKSVWWTWMAPGAGQVTIDTTGSNFNTLLAAYTGTSVSTLTKVASNDNDTSGGTTSKVTFSTTLGKIYQIAVDGYNGAAGAISLHLGFLPAIPAKPIGVAASDGTFSDRVRITWKASVGATAYEVWRSNTSTKSKGDLKIGDVLTTTFDDTTALAGKTYWYWIKAKNAGGTSDFSASNSGYRAIVSAGTFSLTGQASTLTKVREPRSASKLTDLI